MNTKTLIVARKLVALLLGIGFAGNIFAFTKNGKTYLTDGTQRDVNAAVAAASAGDTVTIPPGTFSNWGAGGLGTVINKALTLQGAGIGVTRIVQAPTGSSGLIYAQASNCVIRSFTVQQSNARLFVCTGSSGWRFTDLDVRGGSGRLWDVDSSYGLIDNSVINMPGEQMFMYGKTDSWTTDSTMGTDQAWYIEDCVFYSDGYTDANAYGKMVMRFNKLHGMMKFDSHGVWSDSPPHSARHIEVYSNVWYSTGQGGWWTTVEFRGGTGRIFNNVAMDGSFSGRGVLRPYEYGAYASGGSFPRYMGPDDYPILEQVGIGKNQLPEPVYLWGNRKGGPTGGVMPVITDWNDIPQAAIDAYRSRIGNPNARYVMGDVVKKDRDWFTEPYGSVGNAGGTPVAFNGSTGVGIGTSAQMNAITPSKTNVAFWVTDEGEWNSRKPGPDGQLYVWNGRRWVLNYTPYTYPHPLRAGRSGPTPPTGVRTIPP